MKELVRDAEKALQRIPLSGNFPGSLIQVSFVLAIVLWETIDTDKG
jgi:hypothetical protein